MHFFSKSSNKMSQEKKQQDASPKKETDIVLETPQEIIITLVPENLVKNYELALIIFNVSTPVATALWTAYFTIGGRSLLLSSSAFTLLSVSLFLLMITNRKKAFSTFVKKRMELSNFK